MTGLGTIVNVVAVLVGGFLGLIFRKGLPDDIKAGLIKAIGISVLFIGISGTLKGMFVVNADGVAVQGTFLLIISMVLGTLIGEILKLESHLNNVGERLKTCFHDQKDPQFVDGFVTATLVICVGAMAVVGALEDGLNHDYSILYAKALLDGVFIMILSSTMGVGVLFSALPLLIYQGAITLGASALAPYLSDVLVANLSYIGSVLITVIGINMIWDLDIKIGNMLPAILIPVVWALF